MSESRAPDRTGRLACAGAAAAQPKRPASDAGAPVGPHEQHPGPIAPHHLVNRRPHRFEPGCSSQTLAEGLAEYYAAHPQLKRGALLSPEARAFFHCHDVVHVLYGCGTSMPDEAIVKIASIFGTTGGLSVLRGYRLHESRDIYTKLRLGSTLQAVLLAPYLIVRTVWRCKRQAQPWPWSQHQQYMNTPLAQLRAEFGVHRTGVH